MNIIKPYYIVKTTLDYAFFLKNIAKIPPAPPPQKKSPTARSPTFCLVGSGTHFYRNQLKFTSFKLFTDCQFFLWCGLLYYVTKVNAMFINLEIESQISITLLKLISVVNLKAIIICRVNN